jgi:hypothetical protein
MIMKTMQEIRSVSVTESMKPFNVIFFRRKDQDRRHDGAYRGGLGGGDPL